MLTITTFSHYESWVPCSKAVCQLLKLFPPAPANQCCKSIRVILCNVSISFLALQGKPRLKNSFIVFPMTCSRSLTFSITFNWTNMHKPGVFTGDDPAWEEAASVCVFQRKPKLSVNKQALHLQLCFMASLRVSARQRGKTRSPDSSCTAESAFRSRWSRESDQNEDLKIGLFMLRFPDVLWCGKFSELTETIAIY